MVMNRNTFKKQLQEGLNTVFGLEYRRYPEEWRAAFEVGNSNKAYEEDVLLAGLAGAPVKAEGAPVTYDAGGEAYTSRYVHETIALAFAITEEAEEDNLYGDIGAKYARALARSMQHTKEVKGAAIFNNGFNASYPGGDGVALFSASHPLWGGGTQSNTFATQADLSETALEEALIAISKWVDDRGIPVAIRGLRLVLPPDLQFIAERILASSQRPGSADNDINALKSKGMIPGGAHEMHRLTDPDAWFIVTDAMDGLKHMVRKSIQRGIEGDFETGNMRYKARERYSFGWSDHRGAFGSSGAA